MDWFWWENLHRKPMGFYHQILGFPVKIFPSSNVNFTWWKPHVQDSQTTQTAGMNSRHKLSVCRCVWWQDQSERLLQGPYVPCSKDWLKKQQPFWLVIGWLNLFFWRFSWIKNRLRPSILGDSHDVWVPMMGWMAIDQLNPSGIPT